MNIPEGLRTQVADYVSRSQSIIRDYGDAMTEKETETWLVEPLLEILQWDTKSPAVRKDYPIKTEGRDYKADYALMVKSKPRILIEVKKVAYDLAQEHVTQLMKYAFYEKSDLFVLTNGDEWRVYEPYYMKDMIFSLDLETMADNLSNLWLLSRECVETDLLDWEIDRRYAIEKVYGYIESNRSNWISDIEAMSKTFTAEAIGKVFDRIILDKSVLLRELSSEGRLPEVDIGKPVPTDTQLTSLTDNHTGKSILGFTFGGSTYEVQSWRELLLTLCSVIRDKHRDEFDRVLEVGGREKPYFAHDASLLRDPKQIPDTDIYVETNVSANFATRICSQMMAKFGYSDEDLKLKVQAISHESPEPGEYTIEARFSGTYSAMRPVCDALESRVKEFGDDVKVNVRKRHIGFMRHSTFAIVHLGRGGIDLGLTMDPSIHHDKLVEASNWYGWSRVNRVATIHRIEDIDDQVIGWIRQSYERS